MTQDKYKDKKFDAERNIHYYEDHDIDFSDNPALDENFFKHAKIVEPKTKDRVTIRLDSDMLAWYKQQGIRYQTLINRVLRTYYKAKSDYLPE